MDDKKRQTLDNIEMALDEMLSQNQISVIDYSYQIVLLSYDFIEDENFLDAIRIIQKANSEFLFNLKKYKTKKTEYAKKAFIVYKQLGLEFCIPKIGDIKN